MKVPHLRLHGVLELVARGLQDAHFALQLCGLRHAEACTMQTGRSRLCERIGSMLCTSISDACSCVDNSSAYSSSLCNVMQFERPEEMRRIRAWRSRPPAYVLLLQQRRVLGLQLLHLRVQVDHRVRLSLG